MKIQLIRPKYIVKYYGEDDKCIGYSCTNEAYLEECKNEKEVCGRKVVRVEVRER